MSKPTPEQIGAEIARLKAVHARVPTHSLHGSPAADEASPAAGRGGIAR